MTRAASQAADGLTGEVAEQVRKQVRAELSGLMHKILDGTSYEEAEAALATLPGQPLGAIIGQLLNAQLARVLVHLVAYYRGLHRVRAA